MSRLPSVLAIDTPEQYQWPQITLAEVLSHQVIRQNIIDTEVILVSVMSLFNKFSTSFLLNNVF